MLIDLLRIFRQSTAWLWAHRTWTLALVALGTCLDALAPWLQLRANLPDHPMTAHLLAPVVALPLTLYAVPRFLLFLDAETLNSPLNPRPTWAATFEARWLRLLGAKLLVALVVLVGLLALIIPGLMLWAALGWAPTLVLLRDFDLKRALRGSLQIMGVHAAKVIFTVLGAVLLVLLPTIAATGFLPTNGQELTPLFRLKSPAMWAFNALGTLSTLWVSATLLALFHQVEATALLTPSSDSDA